ncbi:SDR family oxidoreductase [Limibaculum sp. FT325]|uniref:SDR family oxidoreductase n=1 Tax=Thermohalobaculum sediminis TaxID=2939436 RepID=UPI0020BF2B9C|nr:SDR family oxidoreductase [Limibaculum sediminis]MCL5776695.1 SDR family oxidoreductase [Limibaculum sediminis]
MPRATLLSFGHGYSAQALARRLTARGWRVIGTTRSEGKAALIRETGAEALVWPGAALGPALDAATHLMVSAGPDAAGDPVLAAAGEAIRARATQFEWVGYLSTTGVYGDRGGDWVDEGSECRPSTRRGQWRLEAEQAWQRLHREAGLPLHIFRLAGIYGPGRGPFAKVRDGTARRIVKPGQVFSRIHVEDIASVLEASIARPRPGAVYNVCDDEAAPPEDVIAHAAELLGLPLPEAVAYDEAEMTPMARSFYAESKRVANGLMHEELGVELAYPTYREGLAALLAEELARAKA